MLTCAALIYKKKNTFVFFLSFFQTELNVLPVICFIYYLFNIAKALQGVQWEVAPRWVASSKMYTDCISSHEVEGVMLGKGCLDVSRAPPLCEDTHLSVTVWFHGWTCEKETEWAVLQRSSTLLPSNHFNGKKRKTNRQKKPQKTTSDARLWLQRYTATVPYRFSSKWAL